MGDYKVARKRLTWVHFKKPNSIVPQDEADMDTVDYIKSGEQWICFNPMTNTSNCINTDSVPKLVLDTWQLLLE